MLYSTQDAPTAATPRDEVRNHSWVRFMEKRVESSLG